MDQNWCKHVRAITKVIFNYIASPQLKISQKVFFLGGGYFLIHTVYNFLIRYNRMPYSLPDLVSHTEPQVELSVHAVCYFR